MNESGLRKLLSQLAGNPGASAASIQSFETEARLQIPTVYKQVLLQHDGGEAVFGRTELTVWNIGYISQAHSEFEVEAFMPGVFLFASDQKADAYGFDLRAGSTGSLVKVPMIGMCWEDSIVMGQTLEELLDNLAKS